MSKADEIRKRWEDGEKQIDIANDLGVSEPYVSGVLKPLKKRPEPIPTIPEYIKNIMIRIDRNLDKTWGYDNKSGREKGKPKYRNLWEDWNYFKKWFESLS